jgi:phosphatidylinositol alpha 1,6-mannosyltransferase
VPVVAPRSGGAPEVVRNLESGLLYDADASHAFAEATANLAADPSRKLLGEQGRELVASRDWVTAVDELIERHYLGQHASR